MPLHVNPDRRVLSLGVGIPKSKCVLAHLVKNYFSGVI